MEKPIKFFLKINRISYHAKYKKFLIKKKKKTEKEVRKQYGNYSQWKTIFQSLEIDFC